MVYARKNHLPSHVRVNKCGAVSLLSFVRNLGLNDRVVFEVEVNDEDKSLRLVPSDLAEVPDNV